MHVFITGISSGIGKAFLEHFLNEGVEVTGIGRTKASIDGNYSFLECDFKDIASVRRLSLESHEEELIFINNTNVLIIRICIDWLQIVIQCINTLSLALCSNA